MGRWWGRIVALFAAAMVGWALLAPAWLSGPAPSDAADSPAPGPANPVLSEAEAAAHWAWWGSAAAPMLLAALGFGAFWWMRRRLRSATRCAAASRAPRRP